VRGPWSAQVVMLLLAGSHAIGGQTITLSAHPGFAYSSSLRSGSIGGRVAVLVRRTATVSVGGEVGYFAVGSSRSTVAFNDPVHGLVELEYGSRHDFWWGACVARYALSGNSHVTGHAILSTGLYRFGSRDTVGGRDSAGQPLEWFSNVHESHGILPGIGAGVGGQVPLGRSAAAVEVEVRLHAIIGAGSEAVYPVATLTAGLRRQVGR